MSKTLYLRVTMPDGSKWDVPASIIAEERAVYFANNDVGHCLITSPKYKDWLSVYEQEYWYTMNDFLYLEDWATNNMNWSDVRSKAVKVEKPRPIDYQEGWLNGSKKVVEY